MRIASYKNKGNQQGTVYPRSRAGKRSLASGAAVVMAMSLVAPTELEQPPKAATYAAKEVQHTPSPIESKVGELLLKVTADPTVSVGCVPDTAAKIMGMGLGLVAPTQPKTIRLRQSICSELDGIPPALAGDADLTVEQVRAIDVLAHEVAHVQGYFDEAAAACISLQKAPDYLVTLGASDTRAIRASAIMINLGADLPPNYLSAGCYDGGPLDVNSNNGSRFPTKQPTNGNG